MKATNQIWNVMNDRKEWLDKWIRQRQYDIGDKASEFLYVYYCTIRNYMDEEYAKIRLENINQRLTCSLSEEQLQEQVYDKFRSKLTNEDIIRRLGVVPAEAETLRIGENMKKRQEGKQRSEEKKQRNKEIQAKYYNGVSEQTLCEMYNLKLRQIQNILKPVKEQKKKQRDRSIQELHEAGYSVSDIAFHCGCGRDTVYNKIKELENGFVETMQSLSELEEIKSIKEMKRFVVNGVEELFSLYKEKRMVANINEQSAVLDKLRNSSRNIAIFGSGGTGKTTLLNDYLDSLSTEDRESTLILAPTGTSATHISNAQTIHKAFALECDIQPNVEITDIPSILAKVNQIVLDEVNLIRVDLFDYICRLRQYVKDIENRDIRIIVLGDFAQIKPTTLKTDYIKLKEEYPYIKDVYAYSSQHWDSLDFDVNHLYYVHRQDNLELIEKLEEIKYGKTSAIEWFNDNCNKEFDEDAISLCTTNKLVDSINSAALMKFSEAEIVEFHAIQKGNIQKAEMPVAEVLQLAVGMRVMTTTNTKEYQNGSLGTITKINQQSIRVLLDTGLEVNVKRMKFKLGDGKEFQQLPVRMAYAITVNKSEGCTFDKANIVVGKGFFECGQLYVALSRVRTLEGIHLIGKLSVSDLKVDKNALKYTVDMKTSDT